MRKNVLDVGVNLSSTESLRRRQNATVLASDRPVLNPDGTLDQRRPAQRVRWGRNAFRVDGQLLRS